MAAENASSSEKLPLIDVAPLLGSPGTNPIETLAELDRALRTSGFLYIKNHGISPEIQKRLIEISRQFFAEDIKFKMRISMKNGGRAWRGYFPIGGELTSGKPDQKEGLYFGRELKPDHNEIRNKMIPFHGANQWPPDSKYDEFKNLITTYMAQLTHLGQKMMAGIAMSLGLEKDYFLSRFTKEPTILFRIFNYPRHHWNEAQDEWGVREHTDMGFLTILLQDSSGGLQVKSRNGGWISAPPIENTFVVNIGDMLEVWTHGIYRATPHRVRNEGAGDRLSLPFFFDPGWHTTLEPISPGLLPAEKLQEVGREVPQRWDGLNLNTLSSQITYGEFVWSKVRNVFPDLA